MINKGLVGIFWGIPGAGDSWVLLTDATPLAEAELYGDFLTHPRGHYEAWERWKEQGLPIPADKSVAKALAGHEYEDFPRGRIVYEVKTRRFIIYADRKLQGPSTIAAIVHAFNLTNRNFVVRSDSHYQSK
jgi:hypothetical protein